MLFLSDADPSLQGTLNVMNAYSVVTGLKVNWAKSLLFPIDLGAQATACLDTPLQWVTEFKYFGVVISRQVSDYFPINIDPVVQEVKTKLKTWEKLP